MDWGVVIMWAAISWLFFEIYRVARVQVDLHCWGLVFMVRPVSGQLTIMVGPILVMVDIG